MTQTTLMNITAENGLTTREKPAAATGDMFDVPHDVQNHLDLILDYYAEKAMKPHVQLSGDPLHVTSALVMQLQKTLPAHLGNSGKIVLDFMIRQITSFCREQNAGRVSFSFEFKR